MSTVIDEVDEMVSGMAAVDIVRWFDPSQLIPWPDLNPRKHFDPAHLDELVESIRENGILQPVLVHDTGGEPLWIVAGETRWRAAKLAGVKIPAIVKKLTLAQALRIALIENMQRNDLTAIEEARGFQALLRAEFTLTQDRLAEQIGKSQEYVSNRLRLLKLPEDILALVEAGILLPAHARDYLLPFVDIPASKRKELFKRVIHDVERAPRRSKGEQFRADEIFDAVVRVARDISKPTSGTDRWTVVFDPKKHDAECKCNGPRFKYSVHGGSAVRCFDDNWWQKAQDAARRAKKKNQQSKASGGKKATPAKEPATDGELTQEALEKKYGWGAASFDNQVVDASQLEGVAFVVAKARGGGKKIVYCTDKKKLEAARKLVTSERDRLYKAAEKQRTESDIAEAAKVTIEPWALRSVLRLVASGDSDLVDVLDELFGIRGSWSDMPKKIMNLPDEKVGLLFKVVAIRSKRGDYDDYNDPVERLIDKQLEEKYRPGMDALRKKVLAEKSKPAPKPSKKAEPKAAKPETKTRKRETKAPKSETKPRRAGKRTPNPLFMKPLQPSSALAAVVGEKAMPRSEVTKKVWAYIKSKGLQDKKNVRMINADENLSAVFGGKKQVSMFEMTKLVNKHLTPAA